MFFVIVPTIRPNIERFTSALHASITEPADIHILHGADGAAQTVNRGMSPVDTSRHDIVVRMDDDILLRPGWQTLVRRALEAIPTLGLCGLDLSHTPAGAHYMTNPDIPPIHVDNGIDWREYTRGNIGGIFLACRGDVVELVTPVPIVEGTKYQFYEDYWRCCQVRKAGLRVGYLYSDPPLAEMIEYPDSEEYLASKRADVETAKASSTIWR